MLLYKQSWYWLLPLDMSVLTLMRSWLDNSMKTAPWNNGIYFSPLLSSKTSSAAFFSDIIEKGVVLLDFCKCYFLEVAWQVTCAVRSTAGVSVTVALPRDADLREGFPATNCHQTHCLAAGCGALPPTPDPALFSTALVKFLTAKYEDR